MIAGFDARGFAAIVRERLPDDAARRAFVTAHRDLLPGGMRTIGAAAASRPVEAVALLGLAAALDLDPVTLAAPAADMPAFGGAMLWNTFGCALTVARHLRRDDQRGAAKAAGTSLATVSRAENGHPVSTDNLFRLSAYAGRHPHVWTTTPLKAEALAALVADMAPAARRVKRDVPGQCFTGDMR